MPQRPILSTLLLMALLATGARAADPVVFSFSAIGDSRQEPGDPRLTPADAIWLQESRVLSRIYREIGSAKVDALFFAGDMIMGYTTDRATLDRQYAFWRGITEPLLQGGTYVVPVPGNHEVQEKGKGADGKTFKLAREGNERAWRDNMGDLILDAARFQALTKKEVRNFRVENRPVPGDADLIRTDQTRLSFSFDVGAIHFNVVNTDPVGRDSHAPTAWLARDLAEAKARGARNFFVIGHKPAFTYKYRPDVPPGGLDVDPAARDAFWKVIEIYRAVAIFGHEHIYHVEQPTRGAGGSAWQIIAGTAGSPLEEGSDKTGKATDHMYIWTKFEVRESGKVHFTSYGFDDAFGPTRKVDDLELQ